MIEYTFVSSTNEKTSFCFPLKTFLERKVFKSVVGAFFLFLILPLTRRIICRVNRVLHNTCVRCHRGWQSRSGGFESRVWPFSSYLFKYSLTNPYFKKQKKNRIRSKKVRFLNNSAFSPKNYPICNVTATSHFFGHCSDKNWKKSTFLESQKI